MDENTLKRRSLPPLRRAFGAALPLLAALALPGAAAPAAAQEVTGQVTEQTFGDPQASVMVALLDADGNRVRWVLTDAEGRYRMAVEPGVTYTLSAARLGFHDRVTEPFSVQAGQSLEVNIALEINPVQLEQLLVEQRAGRLSSGRELVQRHQLLGKGVFLSGAVINAQDPHYTLDAFREVEGIMVNGNRLVAMQGPYRCLKFLHNNLPLRHEAGYNQILPVDIAAVEIYREFAEVPPDLRFEALDHDRETGEVRHCGLINMWTKGAW